MKISEIKVIRYVLKREFGFSWSLFIIKSLIKKRELFKKTHWINEKSDESEFAKRVSLSSAIYLNLIDRVGKEKAFDLMREILVQIGSNEQIENVKRSSVFQKKELKELLLFMI